MTSAGNQPKTVVHKHTGWVLPIAIFIATTVLCVVVLAYYLRPSPQGLVEQQPAPTADAHIVRLTVHNTRFAIPANYLVYDRERQGGAQSDVALYAALPDMAGYSLARAQDFTSNAPNAPVVYLLLREDRLNLGEQERLTRIYFNYVKTRQGTAGLFGLTQYTFRNDSGYRSEDLFVGLTAHGPAVLRCVRFSEDVPSPSCLRDLPVAHGVALSYRFKRAHLAHWAEIAQRVEALIQSFEVTPLPIPSR